MEPCGTPWNPMEPASTYNEDNARKELKFEKYLKPTVPFQISASKVNGLSMEGFNVILRGKIVENALPLNSDNQLGIKI